MRAQESGAAPRLARALLRLIPSREAHEQVRADLDEEFADLLARSGPKVARAWYRRYALLSVWDALRGGVAGRLRRESALSADSARRGRPLTGLGGDIRYSMRALRREPMVTLALLVTVMISFAATSAVASVYWGVVVRPLPLEEPDRVVRVSRTSSGIPEQWRVVGLPDLYDWRAHGESLGEVAGWSSEAVTLTGQGDPERIALIAVTDGLWRVLGASVIAGRFFDPGEFAFGAHRVVLVTHDAWQRRFGGDPTAVGRTVLLDGEAHAIVGVLAPRALDYPGAAEFWRPLAPAPGSWHLQIRGASWLTAVARIRPGVPLAMAQAGMSALQARLVAEHPRENEGQDGILLEPLAEVLAAPAKPVLRLLAGVMGIVLLIACANVTVLVLARANRRRGELALRRVIGGGSARIARQLLTEMLLVGAAGAALGLMVAPALVTAMLSLFPGGLPRASEIVISTGVVAAVAVVVLAACVAAALVPLRLTGGRLVDEVRQAAGRVGGRARWELRSGLAVTQVALSIVLFISAFLFVGTLRNLDRVEPGFDAERVLTFRVSAAQARYPAGDQVVQLFESLISRLEALPGVETAGAVNFLPFAPGEWGGAFSVPGDVTSENGIEARVRISWGDYYDALHVPIVSGRVFDRRDHSASVPVALLNQAAARAAFGGAPAVGRTIEFEGTPREIVGVIGNVRHHNLAEDAAPEVHVPGVQFPQYAATIALRTRSDPASVRADARAIVRAVDPDLVITSVATMQDRLRTSVEPERFRAVLSSFLCVVALLLALFGVYGVMAHVVSQRVREIGIRMALGERRRSIVWRILADSARLTSAGLALGLFSAWLAAAWVQRFLFAMDSRDLRVFAVAPLLFLVASMLAALLPAWRAGRTDPMRAIRAD
ncbi:MAG: ABC transporter permease [Gemmatimonadetes bacterium]|nr:ABC transporter permease [Gemmatimonadota bacterium]